MPVSGAGRGSCALDDRVPAAVARSRSQACWDRRNCGPWRFASIRSETMRTSRPGGDRGGGRRPGFDLLEPVGTRVERAAAASRWSCSDRRSGVRGDRFAVGERQEVVKVALVRSSTRVWRAGGGPGWGRSARGRFQEGQAQVGPGEHPAADVEVGEGRLRRRGAGRGRRGGWRSIDRSPGGLGGGVSCSPGDRGGGEEFLAEEGAGSVKLNSRSREARSSRRTQARSMTRSFSGREGSSGWLSRGRHAGVPWSSNEGGTAGE